MSRIFINREKELEFLERKYNSNKKEVIIIYGRRRVGKTELIKEFIKGKDAIYFLADRRGPYLNSKRFMELVSEFFDYPYLEPRNFDDVFRIIAKLAKKRLVVVIDEFSYLLEQDNAIASVFQYIIDEILTEKIMLILCGSLISTMESTFSYRNPLYGRRTGQWKVTPLSYFDFSKSLPSWPIEEKIKLYAVTGGVPFYFMQMDENKTVFENILEKILSKGSILYEEIEFLLREELRDPSTYMSILEAIAFGNTRLSDIANYTKIKINDLPKYLNVLMKMDIIKREQPVTEKIRKTKKSIYLIKDNFFRFWFRFVFPNRSKIETEKSKDVLKNKIEPYFNQFVGLAFEEISKEFLIRKFDKFSIEKIGRFWGKKIRSNNKVEAVEIDLVALNSQTREIAFFEVKWADLSFLKANSILKRLKEKSKAVNWNKKKRIEYFGLIAKHIEEKRSFLSKGYLVYDLNDFNL